MMTILDDPYPVHRFSVRGSVKFNIANGGNCAVTKVSIDGMLRIYTVCAPSWTACTHVRACVHVVAGMLLMHTRLFVTMYFEIEMIFIN